MEQKQNGQRVDLYSAAYKLASERIPPLTMWARPNIRLRIHASIRKQLEAGETDPHRIAFAAAKDLSAPDS